VLQNGLSNPFTDEMTFSSNAEEIADRAMAEVDVSGHSAHAFLEVEIPDEEINDYFTVCMELHFLDIQEGPGEALQEMIESGAPQNQIDALTQEIEAMEAALDSMDMKEVFAKMGYACLIAPDVVITPDMIKMLDPATMMEALQTGDERLVREAVAKTEAKPLSTLGATFWVWLLLFVQGIAQGRLVTPADVRAAAEQIEAKEAKRKASRKKSRRKARAKQKKKAAEASLQGFMT
jgi:hypothetical protein